MPSRDDIREAAELIAVHFDIEEPPAMLRLGLEDAVAELAAALAREILGRLRGDLGALMQLFYRIDLREQAVSRAFEAPTLEDVAVSLAELVLARELQTVALRRSLVGGGGDDGVGGGVDDDGEDGVGG